MRKKRRELLGLAAGAAVLAPAAARAQASEPGTPILVIDSERLFSQSLYGQRIATEIAAATEALAAENRRLEAELRAEELALAEARASMEPAAFRESADAFDAKVQEVRRQQDAKETALSDQLSEGQSGLLSRAHEVLGALMATKGAGMILDQRAVFVWSTALDVTDEAIGWLDTELGDGSAPDDAEAAP